MTVEVKRRTLMAAAAAVSIAGVVPKLAGRKAIVIGSGFGGAVAAYRLGLAGLQTTVLESGDTTAVLKRHEGDGITVLSGSGIGGGSSFGSTLSQPRREDWDAVYNGSIPYDVMENVYFPRARANIEGYLQKAMATGNVEIKALHEVTEIREGFEVVAAGTIWKADYVFMAAGTVGTNALLASARTNGLPNLRDSVGQGIGTNGSFVAARLHATETAGEFFDDANPIARAAIASANTDLGWAGNHETHLITSLVPERGYFEGNKLVWPYKAMETKAEKAAADLLTRLWWEKNGKQGNIFSGLPFYNREDLGASATPHPLGGMAMGHNTDLNGRSLDYPNLFVVDGSALPGTACLASPALTIAANAERCLDAFLSA